MTISDALGMLIPVVGMVLVLVLLVGAYKRRLALRQPLADLQVAQARDPKQSPEYKQLEDRVRVLERIATDRVPDLAREIEALREQPLGRREEEERV